jgi:hypothetical protein
MMDAVRVKIDDLLDAKARERVLSRAANEFRAIVEAPVVGLSGVRA